MNKLALQTQSGVTLVFSLVILVTLTILGVTSFQNTRTEISMAGNLRESVLTFNAAEAGLRVAEKFIDNSISATVYANTDEGLYDDSDLDPDYVDTATWTDLPFATTTLAHVLEQPKYIIKYLGDRSQNAVAKVNIGGYGNSQPGITVSNFRVTARGTGQSGNARRYVQSYFGKEF
jgi:type IV pilus assembly protein PilX